jgi:hypothetical protein
MPSRSEFASGNQGTDMRSVETVAAGVIAFTAQILFLATALI